MKTRLLYLLPLLLTVTLIVFGEALGDLWKEDVKALFQQNKWLLLAFVLLLALLGYLLERQQRSEKTAPEAVDKDQYDEAFVQFRKNLLEQYQTRLASKTGRRLPVNLTAKSTHFGMNPERVQAYFKDKELTIGSADIASEIDKILNDNARLLLIGDPGAGKTTILLYAAINILNDAHEPKLPLILNLATWRKGRDFAEWYAQNIAHSYSLSPVFVQELLRRNAVVPFFDGFDEVAEGHRDDCFQKMAAYFGDEKRKQFIVSSRKKEYAAAKTDAPVYAEIEVLPLSLTQIKKALSENAESQAADRALLHALEHDRWLAEAVETPFYLNTASFLFGKGQRTLADFTFQADSTEGRQAELVEIFVAEQVPEERDRKYLSFLAEKKFLVFELVGMQPGWCEGLWRYRFAYGLIFGLIYGLFFGLVFGLVSSLVISLTTQGFEISLVTDLAIGLIAGLIFSLVFGLFFCLVFGLVFNLASTNLSTQDFQGWRWNTFIKKWKSSLIRGLSHGLTRGVAVGLAVGLAQVLIVLAIEGSDRFRLLLRTLFWGSVIGSVIGLVSGLMKAGITTNYLLHILNPYQRFWSTFRSYFWVIPTLLLASPLYVFTIALGDWEKLTVLMQDPKFWISFWALILIFLLFPLLNSKLLHHFSLRLVLFLEGKMPLRVVTFMDRMTDQLIFEDNRRKDKKGNKRRGATWRFRHKILQNYFAGKNLTFVPK